MNPGRYPSLPSLTSIRLLHFSIDHETGDIAGRFTVVNLDDKGRQPYDALSYACGDPSHVSNIVFPENDLTIGIARNLSEALDRLHRDAQTKLIWIDAICIDQHDVEERNQQIRLMGRIYSGAEQVKIWLGLDDGGRVSEVFDILRQWANPLNDGTGGQETYNQHQIDYDGQASFQGQEESLEVFERLRPTVVGRNAELLESFLRRPWFQRSWTVQESALARDPVVLCDQSEQIPYDTLSLGVVWIRRFDVYLLFRGESLHGPRYEIFSTFISSVDLRQKRITGEITGPVRKLLLSIFFKASEPRDYIYAFLGMISAPKHLERYFDVDYRKPVEVVFAEAARGIIEHEQDLEVLSFAKHDGDVFPTWVPDWTGDGDLRLNPRKGINASRGIPADIRPPSQRPDQLTLLGLRFGKVSQVYGVTPLPGKNNEHPFENRLALLYFLCRSLPWDQPHDEEEPARAFDRAFARTTTWNYSRVPAGSDLTSEQITSDFTAYLLSWAFDVMESNDTQHQLAEPCKRSALEFMLELQATRDRHREQTSGAAITTTITTNTHPVATAVEEGDPQRYLTAMRYAAGTGHFFITDDGLIGLGHGKIQRGDQLCILFGGQMPFVLRQAADDDDTAPGEWRVIATAYVDGMMNGEGWEGKERELFTLV